MRRIAVLGATGSIGASTLDVIARHPDRFAVHALAANRDAERLAELAAVFRPARVALADPGAAARLAPALRARGVDPLPQIDSGSAALESIAADTAVDTVVAAIVGVAGLASTLAAANAGKRILLANKESIVLAGALLMPAVARGGALLLPVDSEHNAVFQCIPHGARGETRRDGVVGITLTASGGPFRLASAAAMREATPDQACAHPNWRMGRKISVDSATLMNKGLEVIEAHWLFGLAPPSIGVVVHPQSLIHALVEYVDGAVIAELGNPDMRTALAYGLAWPERIESGVKRLDMATIGTLDFAKPDRERFPALDLAYAALDAGGGAPGVLNAANEVAVEAFLNGRIGFTHIAERVADTLHRLAAEPAAGLEQLLDLDARARRVTEDRIRSA